jgi:hypothetical protein
MMEILGGGSEEVEGEVRNLNELIPEGNMVRIASDSQ